ncbi:MAG: uL15 family ribosomal protein [Bacilli bacterium]|nr:uL15 family ribosomal protein [Bacilli bacterium]
MKKPRIHTIALGLSFTLALGAVTTFAATSRPPVEAHAAYTVLEHVDLTRLYNAPWQEGNRNVNLTGSKDSTPWLYASGWGKSSSDLKANEVTLGNYGARLWYTGGYVTFSVNLTATSQLDAVYFQNYTFDEGDKQYDIPYTVSSGKYIYSRTFRIGNSNLKPFFHMDGEGKKVTDFHFYILSGSASASSIVQLNTNGGTGGTGWVEASWNSAMPAITKPTRTGYVFNGYYDDPSGGTKYYNADGSSAKTYASSDATTLYAHWSEAKYTVTLNKNGGTGGTNSVEATKGSAMPKITSLPTRGGYSFAGYYSATSGGTKYYNANGTSAKNFDKDANTTLYAQWTANEYTVTYNANGGTVSPASFKYKTNKNTTTSTAQNFTLATPTRSGYTFSGWTTSKTGTSIANKTALTINGNTYDNFTVTATWSVIPYTISYDLDGGTVSGTNPTEYNVETATFSLINPTKVGYDFVGWTGSNGTTPQTSVSIAKGSTGNKTYTAHWKYNTNVQSFLDKVDAIGEVSYGASSTSKTDINAAMNAYALLSDGEKALTDVVARHAVLDKAVDDYNALKSAAIAGYVAKVNALEEEAQNDPSNVKYNETYEGMLKGIRDAYADLETAELTDEAIVAAHDAYVPYQEAYDSLVSGAQQAFIDKVNAISTAAEGDYANVEYNEDFRALINAAKEAYAAVRDADKGATDVVAKKAELDTAESTYLAGAASYAASVKDLIAAIEPIAVDTSVSDAAIAAARDAFDALFAEQKNDPTFISTNIPNYQRLLDAETADPVAKQILAIGASSESDFADKVAAAQTAYNALTADQKALISGAVSGILSDDVAALNVMNLIDAIGDVAYTAESKGKIDAARNAYDALTTGQKALVVNLDVLTKAEADYGAVKAVVDEINAIGDITYDNASKAKIDSARANYEALADDQKGFFPAEVLTLLENYENAYYVMGKIVAIGPVENTPESVALVEEATAAYDDYKDKSYAQNLLDPAISKTLMDDLQIVNAMEKINAIGEVAYTPECKALIDTAKSAYDSLTPALQALVPNADDLAKAYADYNAVDAVAEEVKAIGDITYDDASKAKIDAARANYEALTADQKAIFPLEWLENYEGAYAVMGKIKAIGLQEDTPESKALVEDAKAAYDAYKDAHEENRLNPDYEQALLDHVAAQEGIDKINAIGELEYNEACKARIDAARAYYDTLTEPQQLNVANCDELLKAEADFAAVKGVADEVDAIGDITYDDASKAKIDAARANYEALTDDQKAFFPLTDLEAYEAAYAEMGKIAAIGTLANTPESKALVEAAKAGYDVLSEGQKAHLDPAYEKTLLDDYAAMLAMEKINAIGEVVYTPECKAKIDAARAAYDALSADQKALVLNYEILTKDEADYAKVTASVGKVDTIGNITYDDASKAKIVAARAEYEALSADQKAFYPKKTLTALENYESAIKALEKISSIGQVGYDSDSQQRLEEARAVYDSLTDEQKALVQNADLKKLTQGEESLREQKTTGTVLSSIFLGLSAIALVAGVIFLVRLLKKSHGQGGAQVKSISILPLIVLASYYASGAFLALYIVAGLALAVWIANLVIALRRKKRQPVTATGPVQEEATAQESVVSAEAVVPSSQIFAEPVANSSEDEEEVRTVTDEKGNIFQIRYVKSFQAKLSQSDDTVKNYYSELKNHALSYKKANSRLSWHFDSINVGRAAALKFAIRGKTLCVYLALDADDYAETKYKVKKAESKRFEDVSCLYRIKNDRRCGYAKDLIDAVMKAIPTEKGKESNEDFRLPYEETKALLEKGWIKELKTQVNAPKPEIHSITVEKAEELMSDETAEASIEADTAHHHREGKKEIINIDTLSQNYQDGDTVTLDSLIEKGLVPAKTGYVKVLARGTLDKKLIVDLDEFSLQAVKMIVLLGGHAQKID